MTIPIRDDQRRVMITLSVDRYNELKATARAYSLSMTGIINNLIGDYLKAERNADDMTGAGLSARVDSIEKRLATLSALLEPRRARRGRPRKTETDLTSGPRSFGGVPADHGDGAPKAKAPTVDAAELIAATDPAPIRATTAAATSRPEPGAAITETETPKGSTSEPRRADHDDQHARAASIAQRAPERVAIAASLARETTETRRPERRADHGDGGNLRQTSALERRLETKRRATAYALHGARPSFQVQGAY